MSNNKTHYAEIEWRDGYPFSLQFEDFYFSMQSGLDESKYVFIKHNQLSERIIALKPHQNITIAETGFGGALNLLSTLITWHNTPKLQDAQLNYISIERYPLHHNDLKQLLQLFPDLYTHAHKLLEQYYLLTQGYHRIDLGDNFYLTLIVDDVIDALKQLNSHVDIWYFDGFSPNKNNEMWNSEVINLAAKLSYEHTTFSTYSANSKLRRTLTSAGFEVQKAKGFGTKREMLYGKFSQPTQTHKKTKTYLARTIQPQLVKNIAIIGGGISGATTAYGLAKRGYQVTLFERNPQLAMEASGNNQGIIYGNFSIHDKLMFELSSNAYRLTNYLINSIDHLNDYHQQCGVIQLSHNEAQAKRNLELINAIEDKEFVQYLSQAEIEQIAKIKPNANDGVFFPSGMWLNPPKFIADLVKHPNITILTDIEIDNLQFEKDKWQLTSSKDTYYEFDTVVLCNSFMLDQFTQTKNLPFRKIRGQVSRHHSTSPVNTIICGEGYVTPNFQDDYSFGATFDFKNENFDITREEHQQNLTMLQSMIELSESINIDELNGKTNIRVSSNDYFPIIGPVSDKNQFNQQFAKLALDKNYHFKEGAEYLPNLYINCGYGSKGLLWATLGGEIIADYISGTQLPISEELRQTIHPNRLYARELIKSQKK